MPGLTSTTYALPQPVAIDGVTHESVTVVETIEVPLSRPVFVDGIKRRSVVVRCLSSDERRSIRRQHVTSRRRGMAACGLACGLPHSGVMQLAEVDAIAINHAMDKLDASLFAAARIVELGAF